MFSNPISLLWQWLNRPDKRLRYKSGRLIRRPWSNEGILEDLIDLCFPILLQRIVGLLLLIPILGYVVLFIARALDLL